MFEYYGNVQVYCPGVGADEPLGSFFFRIINIHSWPPKPPKYFSVGIFEYILASMPNVYLNV